MEGEALIRTLIRRLLINGMCPFEDEMKPPSANLQSGLLTFTYSRRSYTTTLSFRRRNTSRKAARKASVEARRLVPSDCAVWVRSWHTKDGGISRKMPLSMRAPSVAPREADAVGSLKVCRGGTAVGETREEGGKS